MQNKDEKKSEKEYKHKKKNVFKNMIDHSEKYGFS